MRYILICTEGENSEPESVEQIDVALFGHYAGTTHTEIMPIRLGGNQGYTELIKVANEKVSESILDEFVETGEQVDKYLICDYDDIEEKDITIEELRERAKNDGYILIVNKPNFEFFILLLLLPVEEAVKINSANYMQIINEQIKKLNYTAPAGIPNIPKYGKKKHQAENCISKLLLLRPTILDEMCALEPDLAAECYSEMPILIKELAHIKAEEY